MGQPRVWVLVANGASATLYRNTGHREPHRASLEVVPEGVFRRKTGARLHLGARAGKRFANALGDARHAVATHERQERRVEEKFIDDIIAWLTDARQASRFDHLIIIAPPRSLGEIRAALPPDLAAKVSREIRGDLVKSSIKEIENHVADSLNPTRAIA